MPTSTPAGVWLSYYSDGSGVAVFETELEALRYALPRMQSVVFAHYGETIVEAEKRDEAERRLDRLDEKGQP